MTEEKQELNRFFKKTGITLPELLVAAAILAIALTGMLVSYLRCMELVVISQHTSIATKAAISRMELIKATPFAQIKSTFDAVHFNLPGINAMGVSYVDDTVSDLFLITISVSWRLPNGRLFGEDANLNGHWDAGEDTMVVNNKLDGTVQLTSYIFDE